MPAQPTTATNSRRCSNLTDPSNILVPNKAPIVVPDINELGDKRLDPAENLAKIKEDNLKLFGVHKLPGQELLENTDMALGKPLDWREFVRKLETLRTPYRMWVHDGGYPNAIAIHVWRQKDNGQGPEYMWDYCGGFIKGMLPEFSAVKLDQHNLPIEEAAAGLRGWRSVLLGLIKNKVVTFNEVVRVFGDAQGQRSGRWNEQLQTIKN